MKLTPGTPGWPRMLVGCLVLLAVAVTSGCGGGGGGSLLPAPGGGGNPSSGRVSTETATFRVNVQTGEVTISPLSSGKSARRSGRAVFTGSTVLFNSSVLLDEPGNVGRKVLSVSIANHTGETIGQTPDGSATGLRVLFSDITNAGAFSDPRPRISVSTVAGTGAASSIDGPTSIATFNVPSQAISDSSGNIFVTDIGGNKVRKISGGLVSTLAGSGVSGGTDGVGAAASFRGPRSIALNPLDGAFYVSDYGSNRIRRVTPDGRVTTVAGTGATGGANGAGNAATFSSPSGIVVDSGGVIYVAEAGGSRIRKIVLTGGTPTVAANYTVSLLAGSGAASLVDGVGVLASFNGPEGMTLGPDGAIYVADVNNNAIRRVTTAGEVVTIAGTGAAGSTNGSGEIATFNLPIGIVSTGNALIVSEYVNDTMRQIRLKDPNASPGKSNSWFVQLLAGTTLSPGNTNGDGTVAKFNLPRALGTGPSGGVLLADGSNNSIRRIVPDGGFFPVGVASGSAPTEKVLLSNADGLVPVPGLGTTRNFIAYAGAVANGASTATKNWSFIVPSGVTAFEFTVTVEAQTTTLAPPESVNNGSGGGAGSPRVSVRTLTGGPQSGYVDGSLAAARFFQPLSIAVDRAGNLYVGDTNDAIRRIGTNGIVSTVAGSLGTGFADGPGSAAQFSSPRGITVNPEGTVIYVADQGNNRVRRIFNIDPTADVTNPNSWYVTTIAGTGASGGTYTSAKGNVATFNLPFGIALGPGDTVCMTELNGNRIRRLRFLGGDPSQATQWMVTLLAGDISATTGVTGDIDGTGNAARFNNPLALALDNAGNLYVCEGTGNHRIRKITPDGVTTTLAGGISGDNPASGYVDGPATSGGLPVARFFNPFAIACDSAGFLYVCDYFNSRIRRISPTGFVTTVAGTGASGNVDGPGNVAQFTNPDSIAVDASGTLYVADRFNNSIRVVQRVIDGS